MDRAPAEVFPPGVFLREELEERGWTQAEFAEIIGRPVRLVNEIIAGKRAITPTTAKEFAAALGGSPSYWMNLETEYQLYRANAPVPERIRVEARLRELFPIREMCRRRWIEYSKDPSELEARVLAFYRIRSLEERPQFAHAAKQRDYSSITPLQEAWLCRVRQLAESIPAIAFSEFALREALPRLRALMRDPEEIRHVPAILEGCGVRFVVVEPLPSSAIDGVCMWLSPDEPVIAMSLLRDRIDNFWFVLRHEIEHVLRRDGLNNEMIVDSDLQASHNQEKLPERERLANEAAADFCVPKEQMDSFIARNDPIFSENKVWNFAAYLGVHPGIVVGQMHWRLGRYNYLRKYLVKIRDIVASAALTDGYGHFVEVTP